MTDISLTDQLAVVKLFAAGRGPHFVQAANPHLTITQVKAIAAEYGHPDLVKLAWAADELQKQIDQGDRIPASTTRPERPTGPLRTLPADPQPKAELKALRGLADVPIDDLQPSPANPRERMTDIPELAQSMREIGLVQPIVAQRLDNGQLQIIAGHRRWAAAKLLGWPRVHCIIRKPLLPDVELVAMLVENGQRAGLDPIEEARALKHLKVTGRHSDLEVAQKVGRSQAHVSIRIALLSLPAEEQEEIRARQMTLSEAAMKARIASGKVKPGAKGKAPAAHLSPHHPLATRAKARCVRLAHKRGGGASVGGMACGACWESVIRADERDHLHSVSAATGRCVLCQEPIVEAAS